MPTKTIFAPLLASALLLACAATAGSAHADQFWDHWGDGKAELDGYALTQPRYGQPRKGTAVLIYVTEDMSDAARVKADPGAHPKSDVVPVMKLNFVRDFQTGIYDYNVLTSTFARIADASPPAPPMPVMKVSFSSQEWCGHVYQQWLVRGDRMLGTSHSYFDGEADQSPALTLPAGGVLEDEVPILVRDLRGPWLSPGEARTLPFLPSSLRARFAHHPQAWGEATIKRDERPHSVKTALGPTPIPAYDYTIAEKAGETTSYTVEAAWPHRLLGWRASGGETGTLLGSARLAYWKLNAEGGETWLKQLGLPVPGESATQRQKR